MTTRAGGYRGSRQGRLVVPRGARPTSGRVRKSIFDILGQSCAGERVLDLFSGSGALAIEAASRGATVIVCVERDREAVDAIRRNTARLAGECAVRILPVDVEAALEQLEREGERFDLVLADPPYDGGDVQRVLNALADSSILGPAAVVVVEHSPREPAPERCGRLERTDQRRYGQTNVSFFEETTA